jgi:hypothetical protein
VGRNRREPGGFWLNSLLPPWPAPRSEAGEAWAAAARRPPGHDRGRRDGEKGGGDEGILSPHSPWTEAAREGSSTGGGGPVVGVLSGGGVLVLGQGRGWSWCGAAARWAAGSFYRRWKAVRAADFWSSRSF